MTTQNKSSINQIIEGQKKSWLIATVLIAICCATMLIAVIVCAASKESGLATFSLIILIPSLIATIYFIRAYKTRSDGDWIIDYVKSKHLPYSEEFELFKQANIIDSSFILSKTIEISTAIPSSAKLLVDRENKKFIYQEGKKCSAAYSFSDIINYEVYENGKSQVQGCAGSALIGGAFFGLGGLIVGSSMSRSVDSMCTQLELFIRVNDATTPQIKIAFVNDLNLDKSGAAYKKIRDSLHTICSELEYMINSRHLNSNDYTKDTQSSNTTDTTTKKEQLQELKEMLDDGLITPEDYEQKKKQILGL